MPRQYGKNSNFKAKKGRSGRKSLQDEYLKSLVMKKAWGKVLKRMTKLDDKDIEKLALPIVLRNIPQDIKANVELKYEPIYGGVSKQEDNKKSSSL